MIWAQLCVLALSLVIFLATLGLGNRRDRDPGTQTGAPAAEDARVTKPRKGNEDGPRGRGRG